MFRIGFGIGLLHLVQDGKLTVSCCRSESFQEDAAAALQRFVSLPSAVTLLLCTVSPCLPGLRDSTHTHRHQVVCLSLSSNSVTSFFTVRLIFSSSYTLTDPWQQIPPRPLVEFIEVMKTAARWAQSSLGLDRIPFESQLSCCYSVESAALNFTSNTWEDDLLSSRWKQ